MVRAGLRRALTADEEPQLHEVVLPDVATELFLEHLDGLLHELKLLGAGTTAGVTCVRPDLADPSRRS